MSYVGVESGTELGAGSRDPARRRDIGRDGVFGGASSDGASSDGRHLMGHGRASQTSAAYWAIVRSLENFPELATFRMAVRVQSPGRA